MNYFLIAQQSHSLLCGLAFVFVAVLIIAIRWHRYSSERWTFETDKQSLDDRIAHTNEVIMLNLYGNRK